MEDAAVKGSGKWRLSQLAIVSSAVILCVLLYAVPTPYGVGFVAPNSSWQETAPSSAWAVPGPRNAEQDGGAMDLDNQVDSPCSSLPSHAICCDRSDENADVCFMAGDVRTDAKSVSLLLFPPTGGAAAATVEQEERIRPYTRKWENKTMATIHEVRLRVARAEEAAERGCDVRHDVPVHVVTAGGFSYNYFHAFNDGFLPSWLTVQHLRSRVVLAVLAYDPRWARRYREIIAGLSERDVVDLLNDNRTHCFPGAIVGTRFHGYLAVDPARLRDNKTVVDFHRFLADVYGSSSQGSGEPAATVHQQRPRRPRLGIVSRRGTRVIENEAAVARLAESAGFDVVILQAGRTKAPPPPLPDLHATVSALDALVGVHGSDLTSFLFLRPGRAAFTQVAPLGITLLSRRLFGEPAERMGLRYEQYDVRGNESSLSRTYSPEHVIVADPEKASLKQGSSTPGDWDWDFIGRIYLGGQNVSLDLDRFGETLARMHSWLLQQQESGSP